MKIAAIGALAACLLIHGAAFAQLYKCADSSGKTIYQQGPCSGDKAEGKLELQDQLSSQRFGTSQPERVGVISDREFEAILVHARKSAQHGKCPDEGTPTSKLTREQLKRLVLVCDEASKPFYREKELAAQKAQRVGPPRIGMKAEQVLQGTWGEPEKINKTTTAYGVREQWVYKEPSRYVYVENGVVVATQE